MRLDDFGPVTNRFLSRQCLSNNAAQNKQGLCRALGDEKYVQRCRLHLASKTATVSKAIL
jgi:hypothetical protein